MSLLLAGLAFMAAFVLICLSAIWVFQGAVKSLVEGRFKAADEIVNDHRVPEAWLKASRVGRGPDPGAEDKAKALCLRNLDRLIGYFHNCPFVDSEERREVLLQELHAARATWKNRTWVEIRAGGSDEAP